MDVCGVQTFGDYMNQGEIQRCPCKDCIVKVICIKACENLMKFEKSAYLYWNI
jgi:hypothetical protein